MISTSEHPQFHKTCVIHHFRFTTKSVRASRAQRMMGVHGLVAVVPTDLSSALLQQRKNYYFHGRPIVWNYHISKTTLTGFPLRVYAKMKGYFQNYNQTKCLILKEWRYATKTMVSCLSLSRSKRRGSKCRQVLLTLQQRHSLSSSCRRFSQRFLFSLQLYFSAVSNIISQLF